MRRSTALEILILLFLTVSTQAQKLKYKDIYGLLSTKQYEAAEPFLKKYIATEKENPNAFLFMGLVYQEKSAARDILKETPELLSTIDSAILFYDKAASLIDERELKRNKQYYEAYNRRDLRTGEFGVSLSDIQFDLQKKKEALTARALSIKMVKHYFLVSDSLYTSCHQLYGALKDRYPTEQALYLQANDTTLRLLSELASRFDSTLRFVRLYQSSMEGIGKAAYKQEIDLKSVSEYNTDGVAAADFLSERIRLWRYDEFSKAATRVITEEILPLRGKLVTLSAELDSLASRDAIAPTTLEHIHGKFPYRQMEKFDTHPFPLEILELKLALLRYHAEQLTSGISADSADVNFQLRRVTAETMALAKVDSMAKVVGAADLTRAGRLYEHFIEAVYNDIDGLNNHVRGIADYTRREAGRMAEVMQRRQDAVRWIRLEDENVPLVPTDSLLPYLPLRTEQERYTVGLKFRDSTDVSGYFYSITPSRVPDIRVTFPVDTANFLHRTGLLQAMTTDADNLIYFILIYSEAPVGDKFPATIAKVYRADGLSWSTNCSLDFLPETVAYDTTSGDLLVNAGEGTVVFDKHGKLKQP